MIELACVAEAAAEKPGNVTPRKSFNDLVFADFRRAAQLSAPHLADHDSSVGEAIERAVIATAMGCGTNVNLGICLLIAPLAAIEDDEWPDVHTTLRELSIADAEGAYRAIRVAQPGGLGNADAQDVVKPPTVTLLDAMKLSASRDGIARLYATDFRDLFDFAVPTFLEELQQVELPDAIVRLAVRWHAAFADTHIARRRGITAAEKASAFADEVTLDWTRLAEFDDWLRADGHGLNPGTTADIVAATLYVAFRNDAQLADQAERWLLEEGLL